jgi:hypothetical protein
MRRKQRALMIIVDGDAYVVRGVGDTGWQPEMLDLVLEAVRGADRGSLGSSREHVGGVG